VSGPSPRNRKLAELTVKHSEAVLAEERAAGRIPPGSLSRGLLAIMADRELFLEAVRRALEELKALEAAAL
jgi:hypothetical protein